MQIKFPVLGALLMTGVATAIWVIVSKASEDIADIEFKSEDWLDDIWN